MSDYKVRWKISDWGSVFSDAFNSKTLSYSQLSHSYPVFMLMVFICSSVLLDCITLDGASENLPLHICSWLQQHIYGQELLSAAGVHSALRHPALSYCLHSVAHFSYVAPMVSINIPESPFPCSSFGASSAAWSTGHCSWNSLLITPTPGFPPGWVQVTRWGKVQNLLNAISRFPGF